MKKILNFIYLNITIKIWLNDRALSIYWHLECCLLPHHLLTIKQNMFIKAYIIKQFTYIVLYDISYINILYIVYKDIETVVTSPNLFRNYNETWQSFYTSVNVFNILITLD